MARKKSPVSECTRAPFQSCHLIRFSFLYAWLCNADDGVPIFQHCHDTNSLLSLTALLLQTSAARRFLVGSFYINFMYILGEGTLSSFSHLVSGCTPLFYILIEFGSGTSVELNICYRTVEAAPSFYRQPSYGRVSFVTLGGRAVALSLRHNFGKDFSECWPTSAQGLGNCPAAA